MFNEEQGELPPTRITKWDMLALFSDTAMNMAVVTANFFSSLTAMLDTQASFVEDQKSFHEYAARTIETLNEGE